MSLKPQPFPELPEDTARLARRLGRGKNLYVAIGDQMGTLFEDQEWVDLYSNEGSPALSPAQLALVLIFQTLENYADREAAEAVRMRIDWKYALHLALEYEGFDFSLLSDFRERLVAHEAGGRLLQHLLERLSTLGLLKAQGCQRTDATWVLSAARSLNRLELVMETLRVALEEVAQRAATWLVGVARPEWVERYSLVWRGARVPKKQAERETLAAQVGEDGASLLQALQQEGAPAGGKEWPAVVLLAKVWAQQYEQSADGWCWRAAGSLPPVAEMVQTPHDADARYTDRKGDPWTGYTMHITETCDPDQPRLITHVEMRGAHEPDIQALPAIHDGLRERHCLPSEHLGDSGYMGIDSAKELQAEYGVQMQGPMLSNTTWQARSGGFTPEQFEIDMQRRVATCPAGQKSRVWAQSKTASQKPVIEIRFPAQACQSCAQRARCTQSAHGRSLKVSPHFPDLVAARRKWDTETFRRLYARRSGIEGTLSEAVRAHGVRRSRYFGLAKTWLHAWLLATAINLERAVLWLSDHCLAATRTSRLQRAFAPA
jgi:transposase